MNNTILIIEDNREVRENLAEILELSNYKVLTSDNGKSGLELARDNKPDLILCDIMMPELDGYAVLRAVENNPDMVGVPFVFITSKSDMRDFRTGMDLGADDYLAKPFSGDELLRVVNARLKKSEIIRKTFAKTKAGLNEFINEARTIKELVDLSSKQMSKKIPKRESVFMEGDYPNFLYFVASGKIKTHKTNYWGKEYITEIYKEGDFFGYSSLLEESTQKESAMAIEDSEIVMITKQDFYQLLYSNHEISISFIKLVSNNLAEAENKLIRLAYDTARKKVAEALLFTYRKYITDEPRENMSFPIFREDISAIAGISPESVSRNLTDLREEGLIETQNGKVTIKDLKKLESLKW